MSASRLASHKRGLRADGNEQDMSEGDAPVDWLGAVMGLVHPTKVIILETMLWTGRPTSATELEEIAGGEPGLSAFSFHLKQLAKAGVLEVVGKLKIRKAQGSAGETFFYLARQARWAEQILGLEDQGDPLIELALATIAPLGRNGKAAKPG